VYLEDWSGGMIGDAGYVDDHISALVGMPIKRIMLPDTLGLLHPAQVREFVARVLSSFPGRHFDFHGHDDYGLGTANTLEAAMAGVDGVHVTVNGMGERAGNVTLDSHRRAAYHTDPRRSTSGRCGTSGWWKCSRGAAPANNDCRREMFTQTAGITPTAT
jgi:isopropylmalate/homocitrate/citramalate synthase